MNKTRIIIWGCLLTCIGTEARPEGRALGEFLMPEAEEIALALSAAPANVGAHAAVWVLTEQGYRQAVEGGNGFICAVERSWGAPWPIDAPDTAVWNPRVRAPICYNRAAADVWKKQRMRTEMLLAGRDRNEIRAVVAEGFREGKLKVPGPGAMAYMLSAGQYLGDRVKRAFPHLMLYQPYARNEDWGGNARGGVAFVLRGEGTPEAVVVVPVRDFVPVGAHESDR